MNTIPRLISRFPNRVEMVIPDPGPDVSAFVFGIADTLDNAFTAPNAAFTVLRNGGYRSPSIVRRRWGFVDGTTRGLTYVYFDVEDFWQTGGTWPHDPNQFYLTLAEVNAAGVQRPFGSVLAVPPPMFYDTPRPTMSLAGTAPNVAATATGLPPAGAMAIALPRYSTNVRIRNAAPVIGGSTLYFSFDDGQPEISMGPGESDIFYDSSVTDILVRGAGGTVPFEIRCALINGSVN